MKQTLHLALLGLASAVSTVAGAQTISIPGPFNFVDQLDGPEAGLNTFVPNAATVGAAYVFATHATVDAITINQVLTATHVSHPMVRLVNSAYPTSSATLSFAFSGDFPVVFTSTTVRYYQESTLNGVIIPAGSTWGVTFYQHWSAGPGPDATGTGLVMTPGSYPIPPPKTPWPSYAGNTLPVLYDNGTIISTAGLGAGAGGHNASIIGTGGNTFGFSCIDPNYYIADDFVVNRTWTVSAVSVFAYQLDALPSSPPFTEASVEIWNGNPSVWGSSVIATSNTLGESVFSNAYRVTATTLTNAQRPVFRVQSLFSGLTLAPGTYWLVYQMYSPTGNPITPPVARLDGGIYPGNSLQGRPTSWTGDREWWNLLDLRNLTQVEAPFLVHGTTGPAVSGTLNLNDVVSPLAVPRSINYIVFGYFGVTLASGSVVVSSSSSEFSIDLPPTYNGLAVILFDGSSFLRRVVQFGPTQGNQNIGLVTLSNGDVDNSSEVDAADIDAVIAAFGDTSSGTTDVDVSGEVDAADIDIVIANFGAVDQ